MLLDKRENPMCLFLVPVFNFRNVPYVYLDPDKFIVT